jgi:hypothetical protein
MTTTTTETKQFSLGALLSVTTGCLVSGEGFGVVRDVFDHLYPGIMTLGVMRMSEKAAERVLEQHPQLADVAVPELHGRSGDAAMEILTPWLAGLESVHGETLPLTTDPERQTPQQNEMAT